MSIWSQAASSQLFRRGGIYLFSSFLSQGVMLMVWLYLPWKLNVEEIGQFALLSFVIELFARITAMGMDSALLRFYVDPQRRPEIFVAAGAWLVVGAGLATCALALTWNLIPAVFDGLSHLYHRVAWLVLAVAASTALVNTVLVHHVASNEAGRFGRLNTLRSLVTAGGYMLGAWSGLGLVGLLLGQLVASLVIILLFVVSRPFPDVNPRPEKGTMRELVGYSAPMLFYGLFSLVSEYSGRLALESQVALGAMGIFQFYNQIATQINGVWTSINRAWTPHVFQQMAISESAAYDSITRFSLFGTLSCATGIIAVMLLQLAGLWSLIIPSVYLARIDLFYLLLLGPLFCCIYTAIYPAFYYGRKTLKISVVQSLVSLLTIFLTFYFTVHYKSEGAALSWALGIFLTPVIYVSCFPTQRNRLVYSMAILLGWGMAGGLMTLALLRWHSTPLAATFLLAGITYTIAIGRNHLAARGEVRAAST